MKLKDLYAHELALVRYGMNNLDGQIEGLHNLLAFDDLEIDDILKILKHDLNDILDLIEQLDPDIVILTGHDSYNKQGLKDLKNYRNTTDYVDAVKKIRKHYSKDHIFVFAGACQSNFEAIMASGANFASSPKRVNIDAYDPAIVAIKAATTPFNQIIDIEEIKDVLDSKKNGISGVESYGKMRLFL